MVIYGCSYQEAVAINAGRRLADKDGLASKYNFQRLNAARRGIEWQLSFSEWVSIWMESGHYSERGRGHGYCMARRGDIGPYSKNNVSIITCAKNSSDSYIKTPASIRNPKGNKCKRGHDSSIHRDGLGRCRECANLTRKLKRQREDTKDRTICVRGHSNALYRDKHGNCKECMRVSSRAYYLRNHAAKVGAGDTARGAA